MLLGDRVEEALRYIGVTPSLVERWVGPECGCEERKEKLNQLSLWATRVLKVSTHRAQQYLSDILGTSHPLPGEFQ